MTKEFPRQSDRDGGWTLKISTLSEVIQNVIDSSEDTTVSLEDTESIILALSRLNYLKIDTDTHPECACKGECGCKVCNDAYQDFLSVE